MSIDITYKEILLQDYIASQLKLGIVPSAEDIEAKLQELNTEDLTVPQFVSSNFYVVSKEKASAAKFDNTFSSIRSDVRALYKEMINLSQVSINAYERWGLESKVLENRLIDLESRIQNLLLITQSTDGYRSFIVDNFTDASLIDQINSTITLDLVGQQIIMGTSLESGTRIFLNNLATSDVSFRVQSTIDLLSRNDAIDADLRNPFNQLNSTWFTILNMKSSKPVTCELTIKLGNAPIPLTRIYVELLDSTKSSSMTITPLYSNDNYNYSQLPTNTYTQEVRTNANFIFSEIECQYIKFVLTKSGPDPDSGGALNYQFGFKNISFFGESFDSQNIQQLFTSPLSILDSNNQPVPFNRVALETCDRIDTGTSINYFVATSDDPTFPIDDTTVWFPITPTNRTTATSQAVLNLGDVQEENVGTTIPLTVSYDGRSTDSNFISPAAIFHLLSETSGTVLDDEVLATAPRYTFINKEDRILNYQIKDSNYTGSGTGGELDIDEDNLILFRNIGTKGLLSTDSTAQVRGVQRGWDFQDPYYVTVVQIINPNGLALNIGNSPIIIDDITYTNTVPASALTGKSSINTGIHTIKVHKNNWIDVTPGLNSLADLQAADKLYPFNHKLLVEGYQYGNTYPDTDEKVYLGVDLFAEYLMKKVSIFDLINNLQPTDYKYFALDRDAPNTHTAGNSPTRVFVIKTDDSSPDFVNEQFVLEFKLINQQYSYLRIRADLATEVESITPSIDSYKIKFA